MTKWITIANLGPGLYLMYVMGQLLVAMVGRGRALLCHNVFKLKQFIYSDKIQHDNLNFNLRCNYWPQISVAYLSSVVNPLHQL